MLEAVADADQVVIGPGSLFTSVLAVCVVPGIRDALAARTGGRVYVCNLRPQLPETAGFTAEDHLRAVLDHGVPVDVMVRRRAPAAVARPGRLLGRAGGRGARGPARRWRATTRTSWPRSLDGQLA